MGKSMQPSLLILTATSAFAPQGPISAVLLMRCMQFICSAGAEWTGEQRCSISATQTLTQHLLQAYCYLVPSPRLLGESKSSPQASLKR